MSDGDDKRPRSGADPLGRTERLARELRQNLKRRKRQRRLRGAPGAGAGAGASDQGSKVAGPAGNGGDRGEA